MVPGQPWRTYAPLGSPPPERQSPSTAKMLREVRRLLEVVGRFPQYADLPCVVDECDASVPAHWGVHDNPNFAYRNTEYYPVFQCKLMKKLADLNAVAPARVDLATTWSFYFEGERYFEGTRSLATTSELDKPFLNAYRMFAKLGERRVALESTAACTVDALDDVGSGWPEEVDGLATRHQDGTVAVLVWRHADDQYHTDDVPAEVTVRLRGLAEAPAYDLTHYRVDRDHSNSHTAWRALGSPQDPDVEQLAAVRARQGLERCEPDRRLPTPGGSLDLALRLPSPAASLLVLSPARG